MPSRNLRVVSFLPTFGRRRSVSATEATGVIEEPDVVVPDGSLDSLAWEALAAVAAVRLLLVVPFSFGFGSPYPPNGPAATSADVASKIGTGDVGERGYAFAESSCRFVFLTFWEKRGPCPRSRRLEWWRNRCSSPAEVAAVRLLLAVVPFSFGFGSPCPSKWTGCDFGGCLKFE
jgi:hypothetical protein